jgi:hypothetical protein
MFVHPEVQEGWELARVDHVHLYVETNEGKRAFIQHVIFNPFMCRSLKVALFTLYMLTRMCKGIVWLK